MNEVILNSLMYLFAIITYIKEDLPEKAGKFVNKYLTERLNTDLAQKFFKRYLSEVSALQKEFQQRKKKTTVLSVKILRITEQINNILTPKEKYLILIRTIEYVIEDENISEDVLDLVRTLADALNISKEDFENLFYFALENFDKIIHQENLLTINNFKPKNFPNKGKFLKNHEIDQPIYLIFIPSIGVFFLKYKGNKDLRINSRLLKKNSIYLFDSGGVISKLKEGFIYQNELSKIFISSDKKTEIILVGNKIEFKYKKSENGLHRVSFELSSGQLIGVMGSSGVGKSTFLNILSGKLPLKSGKILINGYDLHQDNQKIKGLIGFVPQDDLLIEELTVYQNLYFSAKLSLGKYSEDKIKEKVEETLKNLNLYEIKDQKVGSILNRNISGGQRKRLNIALELIREPSILFVDEPTSGLSSTDAESIMHLLKHLSLTGKLVIVNIHQPSSEIYKLFNQIIILDKGGYVTYIGDPVKAIWYFKTIANYPDAQYVVCPTCGSVKPEEVLEIIEEKIITETGQITNERKIPPRTWYLLYKANFERPTKIKSSAGKKDLPEILFETPNKIKQFFIFIKRNILTKLADNQYITIAILEAPILAFILALFSKKILPDGQYIFMKNNNIPVFLFMSVVVAMFTGLSISAEEIIKDRKILERERFLNLSKLSYLFSKVLTLVFISAFQTFTYVAVSNLILDIRDMFWQYWLVLFSTSVVSNLIGLNISASFKSVVTIYILIPLILVPQMLLGGAMIRFDDVHPIFSSKRYTPIIADLTVARWAYEALAVEQFAENDYEKMFFEYDKQRSLAIYITSFWINEMNKYIKETPELKIKDFSAYNENIALIKNELKRFEDVNIVKNIDFQEIKNIDWQNFDTVQAEKILFFLKKTKEIYKIALQKITENKDNKIRQIVDSLGADYLINMKKNYTNERLEDIVLERSSSKIIIRDKNRLIRKRDPVFTKPYSKCGRAHFYAYEKIIGNYTIKTFVFNIIVLWFFSLILFITLYFDTLKKIIEFFETKKNK